ncbi:MAG TPA: Cof-type HAD-IIB family hydrolase [Ktedonobacteraceae bacterium]|nr:Cof-type HAD-IIB family hydrolase [Ktedonobacteraceae bacterium]
MYRLVAIDLDGTLLTPPPHKLITPRTQDLLCQVSAQGVAIVIATGQRYPVLRHICGNLPLTAPQIIENGAVIVDISTGAILHEKLLPREHILPTLATLRSFGFYRAYHTNNEVYVDFDTPRAKYWYRPPVPPAIQVEDVGSIYPQPCIKVVGIGEESTLREKRLELERIFAGKLYVTQSSFDLIEFLHPEVSKVNALKTIAADLGIAPEEIVAIGDNHNDIGMLNFAGLGVAMGNAHDEVKEAADYVTLSNAQEGVAAVIEELVLPTLK